MKIRILLILFIAVIFSFNGCKKDEEGNIIVPKMTATVDGADWKAFLRVSTVQDNKIAISGFPTASKEKAILITITSTELKTYSVSLLPPKLECGVFYQKTTGVAVGSSDYFVSFNSTVTLTKYDAEKKLISGTFSGTLIQSDQLLTPLSATKIEITNGKFENLSFQ